MSGHRKLSRREFLKAAALGATGLVAASCSPAVTQVVSTVTATPPPAAPTQAPTSAPPTKAPVTLEFWDAVNGTNDAFTEEQKILTAYSAANPATTLNFTGVSLENSHDKLVTAFAAGSGPDIWGCTGVYNAEFAAAGYSAALDTLAVDLDKDLIPSTVDALKVNGKQMGLPFDNSIFGQWNRKDLFAAAGQQAPQTIDQILEVGLKMTDAKNNKYMFSTRGQRQSHFMVFGWICAYGGKGVNNTLFDDTGTCIINGDAYIKAYQAWGDLYQKYKISPPSAPTDKVPDSEQLFVSGTVAMHWDWAEGFATYSQGLQPDQYEFVPLASGPMGRAQAYGPDAYMVGAASKNQAEGFNVLAYMLNPQNNSAVCQVISTMPVNEKSYDDPAWQTPTYKAAKSMMDQSDWLVWVPIELTDWPQFVTQVAIDNNTNFLLGKQTAKQSLDAQAAFLTAAYKKAHS